MKQYQADLDKKARSGTTKDFVKNFPVKYREKIKQVLKRTDEDVNSFDYIQIILAEEVISNYYNGNKLEDFFNKTGFNADEFIEDNRISKNIYIYHLNMDEHSGIMAASPSMKDIINYMDNIIQDKCRARKLVIKGGHIYTICYFQFFTKHVFNISIQYVPFASNIYF